MARRGRTAPVLVLLLALLATPAAASAPISAASDPSIPPEVEVSLMPKVHVCCRKLCRQSDLPLAFHVVRCSAHSLVPYPTANSVLTRSLPTCPSSLSSPFPCRPPLSSSASSSSTPVTSSSLRMCSSHHATMATVAAAAVFSSAPNQSMLLLRPASPSLPHSSLLTYSAGAPAALPYRGDAEHRH